LVYYSGMSATTVKLDAELLREIASVKPHEQTLSAYVREALQRDLRRQQMRKAAEAYVALLRDNPKEREALDQWEAAPLATNPQARRK
jgi:flagellar biosynthesis component FlhA